MDALYQLSYRGIMIALTYAFGTGGRTRTYEAIKREIYSLLSLPLDDSGVINCKFGAASGTRTQDLLFTKQLL